MTIAFVFPGQGSQSLGMMADLAEDHSLITDTFSEASEQLGFDLWKLTQEGPEDDLNKTENTQPALLTASIAAFRLWQSQSEKQISVMAGHSLGEYSALVAAGVINFSDAIKLVAERGRLMQAAVSPGNGAMAAILGLDDETLITICEQESSEKIVSAANFNSPGQIVIAGHTQAVERAAEKAKAAGAKRSVILPVSVPSHCALMSEVAEKFQNELDSLQFNAVTIPVLQNVDAASRSEAAAIKTALVEQLYKPVQWTKCVQAIAASGVKHVVECGPSKVLSGLVKRIDRSLICLPLNDSSSLEKVLTEISG